MKVHEVMTTGARTLRPDSNLVEAATVMRDTNIGGVPVCDGERLTGLLTDRDIVIRTVAEGRDPRATKVQDAMSQGVIYVFDDDDVDQASQLMKEHQIRRLPVVNRDKRLVGMLSLGDLSVRADAEESGDTLEDISQPSRPHR